MFGLVVMEVMTLSGHLSNINEIRNIQEQTKSVYCFKKNSDISLLEKIVLVISKFL
jgi:hypothetical protein